MFQVNKKGIRTKLTEAALVLFIVDFEHVFKSKNSKEFRKITSFKIPEISKKTYRVVPLYCCLFILLLTVPCFVSSKKSLMLNENRLQQRPYSSEVAARRCL